MDGCRRLTEILLDWKPFDFYSDSKVLSYGKEKEAGIQALKTFKRIRTSTVGQICRSIAKYNLIYQMGQGDY